VIALGLIDSTTGVEYSFAIFYLLPITFITWYTSKRYGILFALISSIAWLYADMQDINRYSNPTVPYWNGLVRLSFFLIVVVLLSRLKKLESSLEQNVADKTSDLLNEIEERKKTERELKFQTEKLSHLAKRIQNIKDEENTRIAREIHDELGQSMTAIKIDLMWLGKRCSANPDLVESLFSISETVDDAIKDIRKIASSLRPKLLDELGFTPAVERYLKDFTLKTNIKYELISDKDNYPLNLEESNALFKIFQEAMTNIARHSKASKIEVNIFTELDDSFNMIIRDNGIGLPENYMTKNDSLGFMGMKERAASIGGTVDFTSNGEKGTIISFKK
jgi:signal transduction histidine kinase